MGEFMRTIEHIQFSPASVEPSPKGCRGGDGSRHVRLSAAAQGIGSEADLNRGLSATNSHDPDRFSGRVRLLIILSLSLLSWAVVIGLGWLIWTAFR